MPIWSIYRKEEALEGSELYDMLQRFPQAGTHNSNNYVFVSHHPEALDPILVDELVDAKGEPLTGDALVLTLAGLMLSADRSRAIHLSKSTASQLHRHPVWRLWCGNYDEENREAFKADWEYAVGLFPSWPAYVGTEAFADARDALRNAASN